jgi:hypothetical protein
MFNSFLNSVKESADSVNASVNAKLNEGIQAALQNEKVKSAASYLHGGNTTTAPVAVVNDEDDANVEIEDWSKPTNTLCTAVVATEEPPVQPDSATMPTAPVVPDSVSTNSAPLTASSIPFVATTVHECGDCHTLLTVNPMLDALNPSKSYHHCRVCSGLFCLSCISKSSLPVPFDLLHDTYREKYIPSSAMSTTTAGIQWLKQLTTNSKSSTTENVSADKAAIPEGCDPTASTGSTSLPAPITHTYKEDKQYVCHKRCLCKLTEKLMLNFRTNVVDKFSTNFTTFLASLLHQQQPSSKHLSTHFFPLPMGIVEDTSYRRAMRFAHIADAVADYTGFSFYIKAAKYMYMGSEIINVLIGSELYPVLYPLLENLKVYNITGPTAVLCIYYLGCAHTDRYRKALHAKIPLPVYTVFLPSLLCF